MKVFYWLIKKENSNDNDYINLLKAIKYHQAIITTQCSKLKLQN